MGSLASRPGIRSSTRAAQRVKISRNSWSMMQRLPDTTPPMMATPTLPSNFFISVVVGRRVLNTSHELSAGALLPSHLMGRTENPAARYERATSDVDGMGLVQFN